MFFFYVKYSEGWYFMQYKIYSKQELSEWEQCPPKALFPETVTLNLLLGSDDPDYCNFKMVSSWPPCIQSKEKRDVSKTCMPPNGIQF